VRGWRKCVYERERERCMRVIERRARSVCHRKRRGVQDKQARCNRSVFSQYKYRKKRGKGRVCAGEVD
jgi:Tfp pilus assembly pilus retraction ATPase PilT